MLWLKAMVRKIERKLIPCACGCGELILNIGDDGKMKKFKMTHNYRLYRNENHPNWKGGRLVNIDGYIIVKAEGHPRANKGYVYEHILMMEEYLGRYLTNSELVHHINGIKDDNSIENLELMNRAEHLKHHNPRQYRRSTPKKYRLTRSK